MEETFSNQRDGTNIRQQSGKRPLFALIANGNFQTATPKANQANLYVLKATTHQAKLRNHGVSCRQSEFLGSQRKEGLLL